MQTQQLAQQPHSSRLRTYGNMEALLRWRVLPDMSSQEEDSAVKQRNTFSRFFRHSTTDRCFCVFLHAAWAGARWCAPHDAEWRALPGGGVGAAALATDAEEKSPSF